MDKQQASKDSGPAAWAFAASGWLLAIGLLVLGWQYLEKRFPNDSSSTKVLGQTPEEAIPKTARCPVTGQQLQVNSETPRATYQDRTYYFARGKDSEGRSFKYVFLMNPEMYTDGVSVSP